MPVSEVGMGRDDAMLPAARQIALEWWIPDVYGGMTSALFRRCRAFVELAGAPVDVLTFDSGRDYPAIIARLTGNGTIIPGIRVLNLWDDLSSVERFEAASGGSPLRRPEKAQDAGTAGRSERTVGGVVRQVSRVAADGETVLQVDHLRPDGSLLVTDELDTRERGRPGGRRVTLYGRDGEPARVWKKIEGLYAFWLDLVIGSDTAVAVIDSKVSARFVADHRRPNVTTMHVIHNSHLATMNRPYAPLRASRAVAMRRMQDFDAVVALSNRQREDIEALFGPCDNLITIPNSVALPESAGGAVDRVPGRGIMLASLEARKRIDHAIRAVAAVAPGLPGVSLDIYGQGSLQEELEEVRQQSGAPAAVHLRGFDHDARAHFAGASFFLLTSVFEGFPLVLQEGMSVGCIPIAYDIPYGPADVIEHGVNGFLVAAGDEAELAQTITRLVAMPEPERERMRAAARATVERFTDPVVTRAWGDEMRAAMARRAAAHPRFSVSRLHTKLVVQPDGGIVARVSFAVDGAPTLPDSVQVALRRGKPAIEIRAAATTRRHLLRRGRYTAEARFPPERVGWIENPDTLAADALVRLGATTVRTAPERRV